MESDPVQWADWWLQVYDHAERDGQRWSEAPGLYVFAYRGPTGWIALYVGSADSLSTELPTHARWPEAVRRGATHVHAAVVRDAGDRELVKQRLIQEYRPLMNRQGSE